MTTKLDVYTRVILTVIAVLLTMIAVPMWFQVPGTQNPVQAGIPNQGQQLNDVINELRSVQAEVQALNQAFRSGQAKVQVVEDAKKTPAAKRTMK